MKLEVKDLEVVLGEQPVLNQISLSCDFRVLGLIGASGGGKSTLLKVIAGLQPPQSGNVSLNGQRIPFEVENLLRNHRRALGVVFQSWNLFPHLTALENIILPLEKVHGLSLDEARARGEALLKRFDLLKQASQRPYALSGGQCQRVAIIRAVAHKPSLLLLDEPTSALDPLMTSEVLDLIVELKEEGMAFILATHHIPFLGKSADHIAYIEGGKLIEMGEADQLIAHAQSPLVNNYFTRAMKYG
ncbi:MAG: amino acid ABC transporter ATP-binding protein [Verrucomicrobia bacterium]|nr:amino acid ABC transporter ATP-binding protein [Verrucomicrobiota bacterium]